MIRRILNIARVMCGGSGALSACFCAVAAALSSGSVGGCLRECAAERTAPPRQLAATPERLILSVDEELGSCCTEGTRSGDTGTNLSIAHLRRASDIYRGVETRTVHGLAFSPGPTIYRRAQLNLGDR